MPWYKYRYEVEISTLLSRHNKKPSDGFSRARTVRVLGFFNPDYRKASSLGLLGNPVLSTGQGQPSGSPKNLRGKTGASGLSRADA